MSTAVAAEMEERAEQADQINGRAAGTAAARLSDGGQAEPRSLGLGTMRLDLYGLGQVVEGYAEDWREPVLWLGGYLRDECGRSMDVLHSRAKKLGIEFDKTNWSKILRGRWNTDADNNPLPTPIVSKAKV